MKLSDLKKLVNDACNEYGANCEVCVDKLDIIFPDQTHKEISLETGVERAHGLRDDYYQGCYYELEPKLCTLGETMTLRELLDYWWNRVDIDGNACYKNAYLEDEEYFIDDLSTSDLDRLVKVSDEHDFDSDNFPIVSANFVD